MTTCFVTVAVHLMINTLQLQLVIHGFVFVFIKLCILHTPSCTSSSETMSSRCIYRPTLLVLFQLLLIVQTDVEEFVSQFYNNNNNTLFIHHQIREGCPVHGMKRIPEAKDR